MGRDPANDPAFVKVDPEIVADVELVQLAHSSLVLPGLLIIACGNPFQMEGAVTSGVVSGINLSLPSSWERSNCDDCLHSDTTGFLDPGPVL